MVLEAVPEKLKQADVNLAALLLQESVGEIALTSGIDAKQIRTTPRSQPIIKLANAGSNILQSIGKIKNSGGLKTLYEPTISAVSGQSAQFMSGGEIAVPSVVDGKRSIAWRRFGAILDFEAKSVGNDRVQLKFSPEISRRVPQKGSQIPGINSWRVQTILEIHFGQTIIMNAQPSGGKEMLILVTPSKGKSNDRAPQKPFSATHRKTKNSNIVNR